MAKDAKARAKSLLTLAGGGIVFGFFAAAVFLVFSLLLGSGDPEYARGFFGAFAGAFFAFLFLRIAEGLTKLFDRQWENCRAISRLEHYLAACWGVLCEDVDFVSAYVKLFKDIPLNTYPAPIYPHRLQIIPIDRQLPLALTNLDLVNELVPYNEDLRLTNNHMAALNGALDMAVQSYMAHYTDPKSYLELVGKHAEAVAELAPFLELRRERTRELIAAARVLGRKKPLLASAIARLTGGRYDAAFHAERADELKEMEKEMEQKIEAVRALEKTMKEKLSELGKKGMGTASGRSPGA